MHSRSLILILVMVMLAGCKPRLPQTDTRAALSARWETPTKLAPTNPPATQGTYKPSAPKVFDLIHTELRVEFDWEKEQMEGQAILTLRPWFAPTQLLILDAKGFALHKVALQDGDKLRDLGYEYDHEQIFIQLDRFYTKDETLKVRIDYTARPTMLDSLVSEEAAEDQGLFFINPRGEQAGKPRQIWTQGESHGSPAWFPTFDTPNQRCTDEIYITVADSFKTLSNGVLVDAQPHPDGTRTDHWKMDLPHAPYLFTMVIGNYAVVKDKWRDREVSYYLEPSYAQYAHMIFGNTPEMIEFFSQKLGVDYPWPKYSQVVVRDFVSGAMENTSATTHYGRLQHDAREHLDETEEDIISHELFHQWFGDLVTCESWANLSLNEGFATYGEFLWQEYKYGPDAAMLHLLSDRRNYLRSARRGQHPIIHYYHQDADAMFDAHSYQKGGQVLHMLRKLVGDDAFFAALKLYLTKNAYDDVEIHELRLAFEEVSGQDLNWFFDQWYLRAGHPELELTHAYSDGKYSLHVRQVQDLGTNPVFVLPITLDYVVGNRHKPINVWMQTADTTFEFSVNSAPSYVCFDPDKQLLCNVRKVEGVTSKVWEQQLKKGQGYAQKEEAVTQLNALNDAAENRKAISELADETFWGSRLLALAQPEKLTEEQFEAMAPVALKLMDDPKADVRIRATQFLGEQVYFLLQDKHASLKSRVASRMFAAVNDSSYSVSRTAMENYYFLDSVGGKALSERLSQHNEKHLIGTTAKILRLSNSEKALPYILVQLSDPSASLSVKTGLLRGFGEWLDLKTNAEKQQGWSILKDLAANSKERWLRFFAVQSITEMAKTDEITTFLQKQTALEKDAIVLSVMQRYLDGK